MVDYIVIKVKAPAVFVINNLLADGVDCKMIEYKRPCLKFAINQKSEKVALAKLCSLGIDYEIVKRRGFKASLRTVINSYGTIFALVIFIAVTMVYSFFTFSLTVNVQNADLRIEILEICEKYNLTMPCAKANINITKIKHELVNLDGVSSAEVSIVGAEIKIDILPDLDKVTIEDMSKAEPIIASKDGVVTRVVGIQGKSLVTANMAVRKGQVLIDNYIETNDGTKVEKRALGDVFARVWYTKSLIFGDEMITKVRTGNIKIVKTVKLFGMETKVHSPYENYEKEERVDTLNNLLPLVITTHTFYETRDELIKYEFERNCESIVKSNIDTFRQEAQVGSKELRYWFLVKRLDKSTVLDIYYETEEKISVYS